MAATAVADFKKAKSTYQVAQAKVKSAIAKLNDLDEGAEGYDDAYDAVITALTNMSDANDAYRASRHAAGLSKPRAAAQPKAPRTPRKPKVNEGEAIVAAVDVAIQEQVAKEAEEAEVADDGTLVLIAAPEAPAPLAKNQVGCPTCGEVVLRKNLSRHTARRHA